MGGDGYNLEEYLLVCLAIGTITMAVLLAIELFITLIQHLVKRRKDRHAKSSTDEGTAPRKRPGLR